MLGFVVVHCIVVIMEPILCGHTHTRASMPASSVSSLSSRSSHQTLPPFFMSFPIQPNHLHCAQALLYYRLMTVSFTTPLIYRYRTRRRRTLLAKNYPSTHHPSIDSFVEPGLFLFISRLSHATGPAPFLCTHLPVSSLTSTNDYLILFFCSLSVYDSCLSSLFFFFHYTVRLT